MSLGWINPNDYSFNCFLLLERFQIRIMLQSAGWRVNSDEWKRSIGIALGANPAVKWYLEQRCPECASLISELIASAPAVTDTKQIRAAEVYAMAGVEDFVLYTRPERMDASCDFIYAWNKERLFELADFAGKTVLDVGSGSGRLAFAAAERAKEVYASEPVDTLREYLREKIRREGIRNIRVADGMANDLAYPDGTFDIVMSGHVVGDDYDGEVAELTRVVKPGGWLIDCPGEESRKCSPNEGLLARGWEEFHYVSVLGGDVYRYRKQAIK